MYLLVLRVISRAIGAGSQTGFVEHVPVATSVRQFGQIVRALIRPSFVFNRDIFFRQKRPTAAKLCDLTVICPLLIRRFVLKWDAFLPEETSCQNWQCCS